MNVSSVIARIAGTESIAKITSTTAIAISAAPAAGSRPRSFSTSSWSPPWSWRCAEHPPRRPQQERGEEEANPAERVEQRGAGHDEHEAQDERPDDAVGQQAVALGDAATPKLGEDEQEDEDVVEREALLDEVAGEVRGGLAGVARREQDAEEGERDGDPGGAGDDGLPRWTWRRGRRVGPPSAGRRWRAIRGRSRTTERASFAGR